MRTICVVHIFRSLAKWRDGALLQLMCLFTTRDWCCQVDALLFSSESKVSVGGLAGFELRGPSVQVVA